jgi:hypothetical protein
MEVQLFKTDSIDALLSLYMFFLKKKGIKVIYDNIGSKMSGGGYTFTNFVEALFLAFIFFVAINIIFPPNSAELHEALKKAANYPEKAVDELIKLNTDKLIQAHDIIEDFDDKNEEFGDKNEEFGLHRIDEHKYNDYNIEDDITDTLNPIFKNNNKKKIIEGVIVVGAKAMKILEHSSNTGAVAAGVNTMERPTRNYLEKYIENYNSTFTDKEMPVAGGSKTRGQKRKIVESKRKRGGSKKQKRRSHKRR